MNADYSNLERRILGGPAHQTLMDEARRAVTEAPTREAREEAKRRWYVYLYGNATPLKETLTVPFRELTA